MKRISSRSIPGAFTLVEMLVAVAILALLVAFVAQMVQSGSALIAGSRKNLGADAQAREVFSRFAMDIAQMVKRPDVDAIFSNQPGNNRLFFLSEAPGFSVTPEDNGTLTLVGYRVGEKAGLERLGKKLPWSGPDAASFLTYANASDLIPFSQSTISGKWASTVGSAPNFEGNAADYHMFADGVFRIAYCFLKQDGSFSFDRDPDQGFRDVAAIYLTLAVLDGESQKIVYDRSDLPAALPSPSDQDLAAGVLAGEIWQNAITDRDSFASAAGIPDGAASQVRIYQRAFPLFAP